MARKLTIKQRILVGKDRMMNDIQEAISQSDGYPNTSDDERRKMRKSFMVMAMSDSDKVTLDALTKAGYINGDEEEFYNKNDA